MNNEVTFVTNEQFISQNRVISESALLGTVDQNFTDAQKQQLRENMAAASSETAVTIVEISDPSKTLGYVKEIVDQVNQNAEHVFFDVHALGTMMYLCTVFFNVDQSGEGTYKIYDLVNQRITEGEYNEDLLFTSAMAGASTIASQKSIDGLQYEIDKLKAEGIGDVLYVNVIPDNSSLSLRSTNPNLTFSVSDAQAFIDAVGTCDQRDYLLVWNGSAWEYDETAISGNFGITVSGQPVVGDVMTVSVLVERRSFTVVSDSKTGTNATVPADGTTDFLMIEQTYRTATNYVFDMRESAICVTEGNTLSAGKYFVYNVPGSTGDYWCNYKRQWYLFEVAHDIIATNVTGDITLRGDSIGSRETTGDARGVYQIYTKPYCEKTNTLYNSDTISFVGQLTAPDDSYTDIRTVDGFSTDQRLELPDGETDNRKIIYNNLGHVAYGNPEFDVSNLCQRMNSDKRLFKMSRMHKNDVVPSSEVRGDMWGLDPRFKALIKKARIYQRHALSDEFTQNSIYSCDRDSFLLSMGEMMYNIQTDEGLGTELYSKYTDGLRLNGSDAEIAAHPNIVMRAKADRAGEVTPSGTYRWSRSAITSTSYFAWLVSASGGYGSSYAYGSYRRAPAYLISKS